MDTRKLSFNIKLESNRLYLRPLSTNELMLYIDSPNKLAQLLCLNDNHFEADSELKEAVLREFKPEINHYTKEFLFYTIWLIIRKNDSTVLGSICFHGEPVIGKVEIGYGLYEEFKNCGYMTEAILQLVEWTGKRRDIQLIIAETEKLNIPSQKVLQKAGFSKISLDSDLILWELEVKQMV